MSSIDYPLNRIKAIAFDVDGVLSPSTVAIGPDGIPQRMTNLHDGYAMVLALKRGMKLAVISGAVCESLTDRLKLLGLTDLYFGVEDKLIVLKEWMKKYDLQPHEVAFVGDDVPDVASMLYSGLSVSPADGSIDTKSIARFVTKAPGGHGVARELIEQIYRVRGQWPGRSKSLGQ